MNSAETTKKIRKMSGLNRRDFCEEFQIPYQTMTDWELGHRTPPEYLIRFMSYYVAYQKRKKEKLDKQNKSQKKI